jgi:hypothetical protein
MISVAKPIVGKEGNKKTRLFALTNMGFRVTLVGFVTENCSSV